MAPLRNATASPCSTSRSFSGAMINLGHALKAAGQEEEARNAWSQALAANPDLAAKYLTVPLESALRGVTASRVAIAGGRLS